MKQLYMKPVITDFDAGRLKLLIASDMVEGSRKGTWLSRLDLLLQSSQVVPADEILPNIVTMNSRIRLRDKNNSSTLSLTLVFPAQANDIGAYEHYNLSILSPLGLSVLGRRTGYDIHDRISIDEIIFQPEAAGEYAL